MPGPAVALDQCSKRFGERIALRRVTIDIRPGETVALLGHNGSGKSTLLRLVAGLARPTRGTAAIDGTASIDAPPELRGRIGYVGHQAMAWRGLTARENLALAARLHRVAPDLEAALAGVGLAGRGGDRIDGFSRGMLQRLSLARALLHGPDLLLLDEPATGLDAEGRELLERIVLERRGAATVLVATHEPESAARIADRTLELRGGELA